MAYYKDEVVAKILEKTDIVDIISESVSLKKKGRNYFGCCPFHNEDTASMSVSPERQIFKCFGCGKGGNVIQFVMESQKIDFIQAVDFLAERNNIDLDEYIIGEKTGSNENRNLRKQINKMNEIAAMSFYKSLKELQDPEVLEYLARRELDKNTITRFALGYGTCSRPLLDILKENGFTEEEILKSELIKKVEKNGKVWYFETFKDRLIFPIFDVTNKVIAFGGRWLRKTDENNPKYLNSTENALYHKGNNLYGINIAKNELDSSKSIIITEGYMDCLSLQKSGICNCVASLGTALTENQIKLLKKYANQIIMCYDRDSAGQDATVRAIELLKNFDIEVRVFRYDQQDVKDPDEYIKKYGVEKFKKCLKNARSAVEFKIDTCKQKYDISNKLEKIKLLNDIVRILIRVPNEIERDIYIKSVSKEYEISENVLRSEIQKYLGRQPVKSDNVKITEIKPVRSRNDTEKLLIALLMTENKKIINRLSKNILPEYINNSIIKELYNKIINLINQDNFDSNKVILELDNQEQINELAEIMMIDIESYSVKKLIEDIEEYFILNQYNKRKKEILNILKNSNITKDERTILNVELLHILKQEKTMNI